MTLDFDAFCFWRRKSGCRVEEWRRCNFIEPNSEGKRLFITVHKRHHSPTTTISCNFLYTSTWTFAAISYNENRRWIMQMNYFSVTHQPRRLHVGVGGIHYQHYHLFSDNWSYTTYVRPTLWWREQVDNVIASRSQRLTAVMRTPFVRVNDFAVSLPLLSQSSRLIRAALETVTLGLSIHRLSMARCLISPINVTRCRYLIQTRG